MVIDTVLLIKLGIAALLGLLLGIEREVKHKPVGMKTSVVISVAACLLTVVSIESSYRYAEEYIRPMDPLRLAAQIVSGIGFLGAGVILRRSNEVISGLTTAAIIWAAAGIGIAVGAGFYIEAVVGVVLVLIAVQVIPWLMEWILPRKMQQQQIRLKIRLRHDADLTKLLKELKALKVTTKHVRVKDSENESKNMVLEAMIDKRRYITDVYEDVKKIDGVISAEVEGK
ncbi:MgtC/SapB family protein [Niallia sp. XMNu-256]|uniref:MgtC/SapB family protein n=1 Tax=Niallia sp. XMNu-256 TaxID=3082444 RepID=UPI0030D1AD2A